MNKAMMTPGYSDIIARSFPYPYDISKEENFNKIQTANVTFQLTDDCNLRCNYCYQINKQHHYMNIDIAKKFIDILLENNENTKKYIDTKCSDAVILDFIGGEPLLAVDLIDEIMTYFRQRVIALNHQWQYHYRMMMTTNGTLYFNENVQKFLKKYKKNLSLTISIDGNKELHDSCRKFPNGQGSYDLAIAASRHYRKNYNKLLGCKMTLSPYNITYTTDAILNLINEGYTDIFFNCVNEKGWELHHAQILYNQLKQLSDYILEHDLDNKIYLSMFKEDSYVPITNHIDLNYCGGNGKMIAVDWKGDIYPCVRFMESSLGEDVPPIKVGNIYEGLLPNLECETCVKLLKKANRYNQSTEECNNCPIAEGCTYCQAYNYQENHTFFQRTTYICQMIKAQSLAVTYYWNKYYIKNNKNKFKHFYLPDKDALEIIDINELNMLKKLEEQAKINVTL